MPTPLIECTNLAKTFDTDGVKTHALREASFVIEQGEFVAIMGPSGSGKSTLMHLLGFLDRPTGGTYLYRGTDASSFSDTDLSRIRNQDIGFVFQSFNLLPRVSVFENVELPLLYDFYGKKNGKVKERVDAALEAVGLTHRAQYSSNQLSGGEKQRVAIARALVNNPDLIFADEPTGNLDSKSGLAVMEILQNLNDQGHTVILVTHEQGTADHAKRFLHMMDGRIVKDMQVEHRRIAKNGGSLK